MKIEKIESHIQLHICNHKRDKDEDCFSKGSKDLTDSLKKWAKENHKGEIKVYRSGCLGMCSEGIAMACYPNKELILEVEPSDEEEIKKGLKEALRKVKG